MKYQLAEHRTRKLVLQRFPFNIFYLPGESEIVIVAVAHQKRRPGLLVEPSATAIMAFNCAG
jgi:plasmid stabilization system protein ParE